MKRTLLALLLIVSVFYLSSEFTASDDQIVRTIDNITENGELITPASVLSKAGMDGEIADTVIKILADDGVEEFDYAEYTTDNNGEDVFRVWKRTVYYDFTLYNGNVVKCSDYTGRLVFRDSKLAKEYENRRNLLKYNYLRGFTNPIQRGNTAAVYMFNLTPGAEYKIKVVYPSGSESKAKGLEPKIAAEDGTIKWEWKISKRTRPGTAAITVIGEDFSYSYSMEITE